MEPDSGEYERIVGPMSAYGGRITNPEGFVDAWVEAGKRHRCRAHVGGARTPGPGSTTAVVSAGLKDRIRAARVDVDAVGSDHQPLRVEIDL